MSQNKLSSDRSLLAFLLGAIKAYASCNNTHSKLERIITTVEDNLGPEYQEPEFTLPFGKYEGLRLAEVPDTMIAWLLVVYTGGAVCSSLVEEEAVSRGFFKVDGVWYTKMRVAKLLGLGG
jgi:hypothetical protein